MSRSVVRSRHVDPINFPGRIDAFLTKVGSDIASDVFDDDSEDSDEELTTLLILCAAAVDVVDD